MDSRTERVGPPKPREIRIGQEFSPFFPIQKTTFIDGDGGTFDRIETSIDLKSGSFPKLPLRFRTTSSDGEYPKWEAISPFNPPTAYRITSEDRNPNLRIEKLEAIAREANEYDPVLNPFLLHVVGDYKRIDMSEWFSEYDLEGGVLNPELSDFIKRLRLQLFFPSNKGNYEGRADNLVMEKGQISNVVTSFWTYYPIETGQLSSHEDIGEIKDRDSDGTFAILLPDDIGSLSTIRAKFVLANGEVKDFSQGPTPDNFNPPTKK